MSALDGREAEEAVARFCKLALETFSGYHANSEQNGSEQPTWVKDLWAKRFRCLAAIGDFDGAYSCMMSIPMLPLCVLRTAEALNRLTNRLH